MLPSITRIPADGCCCCGLRGDRKQQGLGQPLVSAALGPVLGGPGLLLGLAAEAAGLSGLPACLHCHHCHVCIEEHTSI